MSYTLKRALEIPFSLICDKVIKIGMFLLKKVYCAYLFHCKKMRKNPTVIAKVNYLNSLLASFDNTIDSLGNVSEIPHNSTGLYKMLTSFPQNAAALSYRGIT